MWEEGVAAETEEEIAQDNPGLMAVVEVVEEEGREVRSRTEVMPAETAAAGSSSFATPRPPGCAMPRAPNVTWTDIRM